MGLHHVAENELFHEDFGGRDPESSVCFSGEFVPTMM
jgi:hypothetical protein